MTTAGAAWGLAAGVLFGMAAGAAETANFLPGGPLAGLDLPLYRTQHGEPPGHPGCLPGTEFESKGGQFPELELYPGSVEHWRSWYMKYTPQRSLYDRQTLLKNFLAKDLAKGGPVEAYAEPVYWVDRQIDVRFTGTFNPPVPVLRCKVGSPPMELNFGTLKRGLYAVRVIAAVETARLEQHRKPIYLKLTVNDSSTPPSGTSTYRIRIGYVDEFYSVAEIHFHAPVEREYKATLSVDTGSLADLLVHNVTLDDALAGFERRAIKTRPTLPSTPSSAAAPGPATPARLARDAELWESFPPINAHWGIAYGLNSQGTWDSSSPAQYRPNLGADGETQESIETEFGAWRTAPAGPVLMKNDKLGLTYTVADLKAGRPLPDPYPFKDDGAGLYTPAKPDTPRGVAQNWFPIANAVQDRVWAVAFDEKKLMMKADAEESLRDAAVSLIRFAYDYPSMCYSHAMSSIVLQPSVHGRDLRCRKRDFRGGLGGFFGIAAVESYDRIFPYIRGNEELAKSIGRFIPWVKTSQDVVELLDVYLVQMYAKQILRYRYYEAGSLANIIPPAIVLGDGKATDPWMEWLFSREFAYPLPLTGLQDLIVSDHCRDGVDFTGSHMYARGHLAYQRAEMIDAYIAAGGNPAFNLSDRRRYPNVVESCYWPVKSSMAGLYFSRIGDVTGPEKPYAHHFRSLEEASRAGWTWTRDPGFAFVLKHAVGRKAETDAEWAAIEAASARQKRAPWLEQRSRVLPNWFGLLETGIEHDDYRFRRTAMIRVGQGVGHAHRDALDLQVHAHGYPMTVDSGQRSGYSKPDDADRLVHNVATADGIGGMHAWIATLSDAPAARSMTAQMETGRSGTRLHRRQVMLVDVDGGKGSRPLKPAETLPAAVLDKDVVTPNSYVFDVVRLSGGSNAIYQFHAMADDQLDVAFAGPAGAAQTPDPLAAIMGGDEPKKADGRQELAQLTKAEQKFLWAFPDNSESFGGDAPDTVTATWRYTRDGKYVPEKAMNPPNYNPESPRKYTRLRVLGQKGARVLAGRQVCHALGYTMGHIYVRRGEAETETVFPALIEPFVGEPFVTGTRLLEVAGNETDARRAVALEVKTVNGRTDICFADGRPEKERRVQGSGFGAQEIQIAGEYGYLSRDDGGLRAAMLSGGRVLSAPGVTIRAATAAYTGRVTAVSYPDRTMTLDRRWPSVLAVAGAPVLAEIGVAGKRTSSMIRGVTDAPGGSALTTVGGADIYLSRVQSVEPGTNRVVCGLGMPLPTNGRFGSWVASNEEMTKFWRAEPAGQQGDGFAFALLPMDGKAPATGTPVVTESDFGDKKGFRLWEYGVGDEVRCATWVSVVRVEPGKFKVEGNVDVEIALGGKTRQVTVAELARDGGLLVEAKP